MDPRWLVWFVLGTCLGSFLNVCIYRLPRELSVASPSRSFCPACRHPIAWYDNLPLLSFAILAARCRHCHRPIHWRYPVVELLAGVTTVAVLSRFGVGPVGLVVLAFVCGLLVSSAVDLEFQVIPDEVSLGGLVFGVAVSVVLPSLHGTDSRWLSLGRAVAGALVGGGLLYLTGFLGELVFRKESMGFGDVKLLAMAGSVLGLRAVVLTFFLAPMLALIPGLVVLCWKRSHVIPYGPFLSLALVVSLFYGDAIWRMSGVDETARLVWEMYGWRS